MLNQKISINRFLPVKVVLGKNKDGYFGTLCLGTGWIGRINDEEEDWLFDLTRKHREEYDIHYGICGDSYNNIIYQIKNNSWEAGFNFDNLPKYPFPERLD